MVIPRYYVEQYAAGSTALPLCPPFWIRRTILATIDMDSLDFFSYMVIDGVLECGIMIHEAQLTFGRKKKAKPQGTRFGFGTLVKVLLEIIEAGEAELSL